MPVGVIESGPVQRLAAFLPLRAGLRSAPVCSGPVPSGEHEPQPDSAPSKLERSHEYINSHPPHQATLLVSCCHYCIPPLRLSRLDQSPTLPNETPSTGSMSDRSSTIEKETVERIENVEAMPTIVEDSGHVEGNIQLVDDRGQIRLVPSPTYAPFSLATARPTSYRSLERLLQ